MDVIDVLIPLEVEDVWVYLKDILLFLGAVPWYSHQFVRLNNLTVMGTSLE